MVEFCRFADLTGDASCEGKYDIRGLAGSRLSEAPLMPKSLLEDKGNREVGDKGNLVFSPKP